MPSFQRMKEDLDELSTHVSAKLPGRAIIWVFLSIVVLTIFVLGFGIGYGSRGGDGGNNNNNVIVSYYSVNSTDSCPPLVGEKLLSTVDQGQSFEGLVVNLQCKGEYHPYPMQVGHLG